VPKTASDLLIDLIYDTMMLMNNDNPNQPNIQQSTNIEPEPIQPTITEPQNTPTSFNPKPNHRKLIYAIVSILILLSAGAAALYFNNKSATPAVRHNPLQKVAGAKKQYFAKDMVAGSIDYKPAAFKEVSASKLPTIPVADPAVDTVIVQANVVGFNDSGLYMYDLKANKTYKLTDGGGSPRIMSDHYLLYSFDTGSGSNKRLGGKLLNLQTGKTQTVFSDLPENVPGNVCCSVSPDGYNVAFVQKNKISVWDIRTQKTTDYPATVNPIDPNFSRTSANDYNAETSYAAPAWLDNDNLIYSDKPASSQVEAGKPAQIVDDTLYKLSISNNKSTEITTNKSGIYDIYVAVGSTFVDEVLVDQTDPQISLVLLDGTPPKTIGSNPGFALISPSALSVYLFSTQDSASAYSSASTQSDTPDYTSFDPHISGVKATQILPRGFIDNSRILLAELDTAGTKNHEYIAVYNTDTNKVEQYLKIN
jgi:hypothetical protein